MTSPISDTLKEQRNCAFPLNDDVVLFEGNMKNNSATIGKVISEYINHSKLKIVLELRQSVKSRIIKVKI